MGMADEKHGYQPTNCLNVFDYFVGLALEELSLEKLLPVPILQHRENSKISFR